MSPRILTFSELEAISCRTVGSIKLPGWQSIGSSYMILLKVYCSRIKLFLRSNGNHEQGIVHYSVPFDLGERSCLTVESVDGCVADDKRNFHSIDVAVILEVDLFR